MTLKFSNNKTYPDIISIIKLSDLYSIGLDELLKGDEKMMKHLDESTNVVKSNRKLIGAITNTILFLNLLAIVSLAPGSIYLIACIFSLAAIVTGFLLYEIISRQKFPVITMTEEKLLLNAVRKKSA